MRYIDWKKLFFIRQPFTLYLVFKIMSKFNLDDEVDINALNAVMVMIDKEISAKSDIAIDSLDIDDIATTSLVNITDSISSLLASIADTAISSEVKVNTSAEVIEPKGEFVSVNEVLKAIKDTLKMTLAKTAKIKHSSEVNTNISLTMEAFFRAYIIHSSEFEITNKVTSTKADTAFITIADIASMANDIEFTKCDIDFVEAVNELNLNNDIDFWLAPIKSIVIDSDIEFSNKVKTTLHFSNRIKYKSALEITDSVTMNMLIYSTWSDYKSYTWASIKENTWNEINKKLWRNE